MAKTLKVLTLNCWGVFSPDCYYRHERMAAIAEELSKGEHDIVLLEEVWTQSDYKKLCDKILPVMPYTHYFHSGRHGCGVCIFSKHSILETFQYRFSLNGYAQKITHGDWFCGKAVGLAKINWDGIRINVFGTHLIAQYTYQENADDYLAHRVVQAHEMSQFIKMTSENCDLVLLGGDLNLLPKDLGCKIVLANANLKDSWVEQKIHQEDELGATSDRPDNQFAWPSSLKCYPQGTRLDYLMYRSNGGYDIRCEKCYVTMMQIPGRDYHYSDHEAVAAVYSVRRNITAMAPERDPGAIELLYLEALPVIDKELAKVKADRVFYAAVIVLSILALMFSSNMEMPYGLGWLPAVLRLLLVLVLGFSSWTSVVMSSCYLNSLIAAKKDINNLLKANPEI